ncbi:flagellar filament outer layer protein FlaA [Candidatus Haliotispira prima]|uniref:Flagellar filament outer layer protein FlaA n=1 Tax=Candidatus Haliotispira prima TaxID=3034016 RepID=A0ABY8MEA4_9SPIO|nr:flagellar filament outer layer protein FlaA [Candidatus Haliotispira prima]
MNKYRVTLLSFLSLILLSFANPVLFAQDAGADPTSLEQTQAQQSIKETAIRSFEDEGFWRGYFSRDNGLIQVRTRISAGPQAKPVLETVEGEGDDSSASEDSHILGVRLDFKRRAIGEAYILPMRPIPIEGTVKTVSIWVAGRNSTHVLKLVVRDRFGNNAELYMGKLNFLGWKKLTATVPPYLKQRDFHYSNTGTGLLIESFKIETSLKDSLGTFYVYFDDLRATTDLFGTDAKDPDDPSDNW